MAHKITFFNFDHWGEEGKDYIRQSAKLKAAGVEVAFAEGLLNKDRIPSGSDADFDLAGVFMDSLISAEVLNGLPNLRFVATLSTGFDHIDLATAAAKGIPVSSVPSYGENTVAEFTFGLILALSRKIIKANRQVREEGSFSTDDLCGFDLAGKTLGVVGTGHIGQHVVRMAKGFGMNVAAFDAYPNGALASEFGFTYLTLPELLGTSDIVTLHVPYMPATHHLINKDNIGLAKKGAYLVNTSRGAVVETAALVAALKNGQLGGAGLDVLEEEGILKSEMEFVTAGREESHDLKVVLEDHVLIDMPNVIITPHNAFNTKEAFFRILDTTIDNVVAFVNGAPINVVKAKNV